MKYLKILRQNINRKSSLTSSSEKNIKINLSLATCPLNNFTQTDINAIQEH